ncbi:MoxR family ATPase [Marispirochaeta aestuarii]|uniref:ATPase n=1 Tax=Marispirochaeta aestuarii TaxID=1963862 RepID=A0A1Y1S3E0_9SPIO|nr:AAA family ATPase [Marispirochaeta aestuarii]ORC37891.1 ATPase [Marispirochaeta aestuarii]
MSSTANRTEVDVERASTELIRCRKEIAKRLVGQESMVDGMLMGLIAGGHVLLEGVPGLAKTLAVKTLAEVLDASFKRLQFTPDLLPADLIGTMIYRQQTGEFVARKGPVFANIVLADEINRAPAKVQSALLEAMEERHVTIGDETHYLPKPFFVLATQNPIESEGTYPLPEAQLDRFMMKLKIDYPDPQDELAILRRMGVEQKSFIQKVLTPGILNIIKETAAAIKVDERIEEYIVSIVTASREKDAGRFGYTRYIEYGASTRATLFLYRAAKVKALFAGRNYVIPEDVKETAYDVLRHRIILSYEAESEELSSEDVITMILRAVPVP